MNIHLLPYNIHTYIYIYFFFHMNIAIDISFALSRMLLNMKQLLNGTPTMESWVCLQNGLQQMTRILVCISLMEMLVGKQLEEMWKCSSSVDQNTSCSMLLNPLLVIIKCCFKLHSTAMPLSVSIRECGKKTKKNSPIY